MSWSRLSSKITLLNHTKNLQFLSHESRFLPNALHPSYKFFKASSGCGYNAWGLISRCEFSTRSSTKFFDFRPCGSPCFWRSSPFSIQRHYSSHASNASKEKKSKKTLYYLTALVFAMVGSSYAAVPLYRRFCQATGYGGTVQRRESVEEKIARHEKEGTVATREIVVQFNADVADGMPWKFIPTQREVRVKPGESALAFYTAENRSSTPITGVSTYNVTPMKAAVYFNKIQCFCFEEQRLLPGEQIDMPVSVLFFFKKKVVLCFKGKSNL
ncbi:hypothetical protein DITRI_Ditri14bG0042900 [Diplodiscus trichospermus]